VAQHPSDYSKKRLQLLAAPADFYRSLRGAAASVATARANN